ncbi:MAG: glycosyltransferase family 2 protein [Pseudomonadota bacterium]
MKGLITAIVPTFNRADYLIQAVEALMSQSRPVDQIIIWDDGSSDHTAQVMAGLHAPRGTELLCRTAANGGKSQALNAAMDLARGDYIWICDDDDLVRPDAAQDLAHVLDTTDAGWVAGRHVRFHLDPGTQRKVMTDTGYWPDLSQGSVLRHLLEDIFFFQPGTLVRRSAYDAVGPFREDISRSIDYEMFVRLGARFPVTVLDKIVFEQRKHEGARGAGSNRHSAAEAEAVWKSMDRAIFADFRDVLPLSLYGGLFDGEDVRRAGLLQRGCVYARRADWETALTDFEAALALAPAAPLDATERAVVIRALAGKHGAAEAYGAPFNARLLSLSRQGAAGASFVRALARGSVWRLRDAVQRRDWVAAGRIGRFMVAAGLPLGGPGETRLQERQTLHPEAYAW